jgi:hypothetical protein
MLVAFEKFYTFAVPFWGGNPLKTREKFFEVGTDSGKTYRLTEASFRN